jgi:hypothetical protein
MTAGSSRFGARLGHWGRMAVAGLAAMFFASACGQDAADLVPAPSAMATAPSASSSFSSGSNFRPLGGPRAPATSGCTRPADYWQGHPAAWWHRELQMGATTYSKEEQLGILDQPAADNGLVGIGQQLIATRLNLAAGVPATGLEAVLEQAERLIGPQVIPPRGEDFRPATDTATIVEALADFNAGRVGPGACK